MESNVSHIIPFHPQEGVEGGFIANGAVVSTFLGKDKRIVISPFHLVFKVIVGYAVFFTFFAIERTNCAKNQKLIIAILGILRVLRVENTKDSGYVAGAILGVYQHKPQNLAVFLKDRVVDLSFSVSWPEISNFDTIRNKVAIPVFIFVLELNRPAGEDVFAVFVLIGNYLPCE
jgi:hypothetical protein